MNPSVSGTPSNDPWLAFSVEIAGITEETPGVATYDLQLTDPEVAKGYDFQPGQFNMLYLPGIGESAISVSGSARKPGEIAHTIRIAGNVTRALSRLGPGGTLGLRGPFGSQWPMDRCRGRHAVIVAGGIGMAPLRPVIDKILSELDQYSRLTVLAGARSPEHLLYQHQFPDWRRCGAEVDTTVDRATPGWNGNVGVVPLLIDRMELPNPEETIFLVCGPQVMMWYSVRSAQGRGVPAENIWLNLERNMNCAIGLCGHCQFGPEFICKDGPILPLDRLAPLLKVKDL